MSAYGHNGSPGGRRIDVTGRHPPFGNHSQGAQSGTPISIPGSQRTPIPPPILPPPRYVPVDEDDELFMSSRDPNGPDPRRPGENKEFASRKPDSWAQADERFQSQPDSYRRQWDNDSRKHSKNSQSSSAWSQDEGYHSMLSISTTHLRGERQLHHQGQVESSQAYDNKLLSKIGKPKTPTSGRSFASAENSPTSSLTFGRQPFPAQPRSLSFPSSVTSVTSGYSDSPIKQEPGLGFTGSPLSRPVSPGTYSSGASVYSFSEYRSPILENITRSSTLDSDSYSPHHQRFPPSANESLRAQQKNRRSVGHSSLSNVDESSTLRFGNKILSLPSRPIKQEKYDQQSFSEPDFRMEESVNQLHLDDDRALPPVHRDSIPRHPAHFPHHLKSQRSMSGTKRKTPPMASEASHDTQQASLQQMATTASHFAQNPPSHLSPGFAQHHGSVSSQSSAGFPNGSYASSGGPSVGGSSYTSLDQTSPGAISPSNPQHSYQQNIAQEAQYNHTLSMDPNSRNGPYPDAQQQIHDSSFPDSKPTPPRKEARKNNTPQNMSTSAFICECCPKKPRKFDTVEEKIQHEEEKQYRCQYCNNRFKNKNEAERHQNSLHLRRHSWSCAVLAQNFGAAFFSSADMPTVSLDPEQPQPVSGASDTCGYCGQEFPNDPQPDWEERTRHLDTVHKFRECNQSKKFFRADHFRQHLKHSHAGASGKWTNRLEQACVKEEPLATPLDQQNTNGDSTPTQSAPIANMGSLSQQDLNPQSPTPMTQNLPSHNNYSPHPSLIGQQTLAQMGMENIDPNIGIQQLSELANMSGVVSPSQRQQQQQHPQPPQLSSPPIGGGGGGGGGGGYEDLKHESL